MNIDLKGTINDKPISHRINWFYPEIYDNNKSYLDIDICHTRVTNPIRLSYDSERNGFVIQMLYVTGIENEYIIDDIIKIDYKHEYKEVGFIPYRETDFTEPDYDMIEG